METNHTQAHLDAHLQPLVRELGLSVEELDFAREVLAQFLRCTPQHPEKGLYTMIERARQAKNKSPKTPYHQILQELLTGIIQRTDRRVELLGRCSLNTKNPEADEPKQD